MDIFVNSGFLQCCKGQAFPRDDRVVALHILHDFRTF